MDVKTTKRTLMGLPPRISVLLEANHGYGKSDVIRQVAQAMSALIKKPFHLVDFRLAQCEVADVIGMMHHADRAEITQAVYEKGKLVSKKVTVQNVTLHDFAEWFPQDPDSYGYLFLDELTRASRDLQNAVMELALDYRYHFKELPIGWRVIAASNDNMDVYNGAILDPALYDRFLKIKFKPTVEEWIEYARDHGVHKAIVSYINKIDSALMPENVEPGVISPSPRSWVKLSDICVYMADNGDDPFKDIEYLALLAKGYIGETITMDFIDYVRANYKIFSGEDIIEHWDKSIETEFNKMEVAELTFYNNEVIGYLKRKKITELNKTQSGNLFMYLKTVPKEVASGLWSLLLKDHRNATTKWFSNDGRVKKYVSSLLSKKEALK